MPSETMPQASFAAFSEVGERIGQTTKRLEKAAILGEYFGTLSDADLPLAARYIAGQTFSQRDHRTTSIGGAALLAAIQAVTGADESLLRSRLVVLGDPGDVAAEFFSASPLAARSPTPTLTLSQIERALTLLAETTGSKRKVEIVTDLLRQATPIEAKYLVKLLAGDLRIGLKEGVVEDALARLAGVDVGRIQWVNMLEGDLGQTALLARQERLGDAHMRLFHSIKFMLATPAADLADVARQMPTPFVVEDKYDGIRAQAHIAPHQPGDEVLHGVVVGTRRVALFTRTLDEITGSYPDLWEPLAALLPVPSSAIHAQGLILDGEILPVLGERILPFQELQKRLGRKTLSPEILAGVPAAFVAYDLLYADGEVWLERPFCERRTGLELVPADGAHIRIAASRIFTDVKDLDEEFTQARARGNEGLMVKDPASSYKPGRRGREWLKIKRALATLDVVVTSVEVGSGRRSRFLSDFTFAVRTSETDPTLLNVGKAYSGLTDAEIQHLSDWFEAHTTAQFAHGKVRVVEPQIVLEVTFDRVQASARHKGGYALRFPRILRIRDDKPVAEIDTIETVRRLAETEKREEEVTED